MADQFNVVSVQYGPLEQGGSYASVWGIPVDYEDRAAPHVTKGPVPIKMDCELEVCQKLSREQLPIVCDLDVKIRVSSGNKSKVHVVGYTPKAPIKNDSKPLPDAKLSL